MTSKVLLTFRNLSLRCWSSPIGFNFSFIRQFYTIKTLALITSSLADPQQAQKQSPLSPWHEPPLSSAAAPFSSSQQDAWNGHGCFGEYPEKTCRNIRKRLELHGPTLFTLMLFNLLNKY